MSVMCKKPPYCLEEFVAREEMTFDQCAWTAIMDHCFFGHKWGKLVDNALKTLWGNGGVIQAQGYRYFIFQYKNPLVEFIEIGVI